MKLVTYALTAFLFIAAVQAQSSATLFGRCPNQCGSLVLSRRIFQLCAPLFQLGCELLPCTGGGDFSCRLITDPVPAANENIPVPGDPIEFEELTVGRPFPIFINLTAGRVPLPLDIYLLADNTGSMADEIATVQSRFSEVISAIEADERFTDPRFGVGAYQDEATAGTDNGFISLQTFTADSSLAQAAVDRYVARGGGDRDEANLVALFKVATDSSIGWREQSRKIVVYFGDVPGHEPTCGPFGNLDRTVVADALNELGASVIAVSLSRSEFDSAPRRFSDCPGPAAAAGQASFITSETGGLLNDANAVTLVDEIMNGIRDLSSTFSVDASDCMGMLDFDFDPDLPLTLAPGMSETVTQVVTIPEDFCTPELSTGFSCTVNYVESGVDLPPTVLATRRIRGIPDECRRS